MPAVCPPQARLLDVEDAAAYLGISSWTLRDLHAAGRLPRVRLPLAGDRECRRLLFDVRDLDQLVELSKGSDAMRTAWSPAGRNLSDFAPAPHPRYVSAGKPSQAVRKADA